MSPATQSRKKVVREHIPLEQGLRHVFCDFVIEVVAVREHIPLEQGLRHPTILIEETTKGLVREHIPLEQGLRH